MLFCSSSSLLFKRLIRLVFISFLWILLALTWLLLALTSVGAVANETVNIGLLAPRGDLIARQKWQPTFDWLSQRIDGVAFKLHPLTLVNMAEAVERRKVDFIITNPGQAVQLGRQFELSWIATLTKPNMGTHGVGSVLVVKQASKYKTFSDLYQQPIAAVSEQAFGGYLTLYFSLLEQGLDPDRFFADTHFLGYPVDDSLYLLQDDDVAAAVVPVCLLETMIHDDLLAPEGYRVIGANAANNGPCQVTTNLYPNWSIAKTAHGSPVLAKQIGQALLALPPSHFAIQAVGASGWTTPVSHLSVDRLYETLDLHPLMQPFWKQALLWLKVHRDWAFVALAMVFLMGMYHCWLQIRFKRSQVDLTRTLTELAEKQSQLEHAQRIAIVGELGSSIAHEINQPLSAIRNFTESARLRLKKNASPDKIFSVLDQVFVQLDRTDEIIQRLRKLIKQPNIDYQRCDLKLLIADCCGLMAHGLKQHSIHWRFESDASDCVIAVDRVGLQQVVVNLLGNAIDACCDYQKDAQEGSQSDSKNHAYTGQISICLIQQPETVQICITDNGTGLKLDGYPKPFLTTKPEGLGLGLVICRDIVERHGGTLRIRDTVPHGCAVMLELPNRDATTLQYSNKK